MCDEADVRRQPGHPEHAEVRRGRRPPASTDAERRAVGSASSRQPRWCSTAGADGHLLVPEARTSPTAPPVERRVERERRDVGPRVVHPAAHVRVDREEGVAHQHLAAAGSGSSTSASSKSAGTGPPLGREASRISRERRATSGIVRRSGRYPGDRRSGGRLRPLRNLPRALLACRAARRRVGTGERSVKHEEDARVVAEGSLMRRIRMIIRRVRLRWPQCSSHRGPGRRLRRRPVAQRRR